MDEVKAENEGEKPAGWCGTEGTDAEAGPTYSAMLIDGEPRSVAKIGDVHGRSVYLSRVADARMFPDGPVEALVALQDGTPRERLRRVACKVVNREEGIVQICNEPSWSAVVPAICSGDYLVPIPCDRKAGPRPEDEPGRLEPPFVCSQVVAWARALREAGVLEYEAGGVRLVLAPKVAPTAPAGAREAQQVSLLDIARARAKASAEASGEGDPAKDPRSPAEREHDRLFRSVLPAGVPIPPFAGKTK